jgi:hypothetical protein
MISTYSKHKHYIKKGALLKFQCNTELSAYYENVSALKKNVCTL